MLGSVASKNRENQEEKIKIAVEGCENLKELCQFLKWHDVRIIQGYEGPRILEEGTVQAALVIPKGISNSLKNKSKSKIELVFHQSDEKSNRGAHKLEQLLSGYNQSISKRQLASLGINPTILKGLTLVKTSIAPMNMKTMAVGLLFIGIINLVCFLSTNQFAADTVAGEKERGSLEPLLLQSAPRWVVLLGKWVYLFAAIVTALILSSAAFKLLGEVALFQKITQLYTSLSWKQLLVTGIIFAPICLVAPTLLLLVSTVARTMKEAQSYSAIFVLVTFIPVIMLDSLPNSPIIKRIPFLGQSIAAKDFLSGKIVKLDDLLLCQGMTFLLFLFLASLLYKAFQSEKIFAKA